MAEQSKPQGPPAPTELQRIADILSVQTGQKELLAKQIDLASQSLNEVKGHSLSLKGMLRIMEIQEKRFVSNATQQGEKDIESAGPDKDKPDKVEKKGKGIMSWFKGFMKMFSKWKTWAMFLFLPAVLGFMNSPQWEKFTGWINDTLMPAMKRLGEWLEPMIMDFAEWADDTFLPTLFTMLGDTWDDLTRTLSSIIQNFTDLFSEDATWNQRIGSFLDIFGDIGKFVLDVGRNFLVFALDLFGKDGEKLAKKWWDPLAEAIKGVIDWIVLIFKDPKAALDKLWNGFVNVGAWIYSITVEPIWTWIKDIFTFGEKEQAIPKEEGSDDGTLWGWIKGVPGKIWTWFKTQFAFSDQFVKDTDTLWTWVSGIPTKIWKWFEDLFTFSDQTVEEKQTLWTWISAIPTKIWTWFKGIFGFGDDRKTPAEEGSDDGTLWGWIKAIPTKIWTWFKTQFAFSDQTVDAASTLWTWVSAIPKKIWTWFKTQFAFSDQTVDAASTLWTWVSAVPTKIWKWITDIFSFDDQEVKEDETVWAWVKGIPGKVWSWLKKTVLGWFGLTTDDEEITAKIDDADSPEKGWLSTMFSKIFPYWLLHPVDWIMQKLGITDKDGKVTDTGKAKAMELVEGGIFAQIGALFAAIFPRWITEPIAWIKEKLGIGDPADRKDDLGGWTFAGFPTIADLVEFLPMWLTDPIGWVKSFFAGDGGVDPAGRVAVETPAGPVAKVWDEETRKWITPGGAAAITPAVDPSIAPTAIAAHAAEKASMPVSNNVVSTQNTDASTVNQTSVYMTPAPAAVDPHEGMTRKHGRGGYYWAY